MFCEYSTSCPFKTGKRPFPVKVSKKEVQKAYTDLENKLAPKTDMKTFLQQQLLTKESLQLKLKEDLGLQKLSLKVLNLKESDGFKSQGMNASNMFMLLKREAKIQIIEPYIEYKDSNKEIISAVSQNAQANLNTNKGVSGKGDIAIINGQKITRDYFNQVLDQYKKETTKMNTGFGDSTILNSVGAFESLKYKILIDQAISKYGLVASEKEVQSKINQTLSLLPKGTTLQNIAQQNGLSSEMYRSNIKTKILHYKLMEKVLNLKPSRILASDFDNKLRTAFPKAYSTLEKDAKIEIFDPILKKAKVFNKKSK